MKRYFSAHQVASPVCDCAKPPVATRLAAPCRRTLDADNFFRESTVRLEAPLTEDAQQHARRGY